LITNWITEITKFAPNIRYFIAHSSFSKVDETSFNDNSLKDYDLVITTYTFIVRNEKILKINWNIIILDEAQNIKNPDTKQTRAVKKLNSKNRIVMTGTPIENRLSDLWSLFDFINPGLLGNQKEFSNFSKSLKDDFHGYSKIKKIVSPFILRRLKTDRTIISDLPDKVEMKTYADLAKKQIILYEKQVKELLNYLDKTEDGIVKKGLILSSLMKFKQLCNHPDQFLGLNEYAEYDSGKFKRLKEICEIIYEKKEKVLVFSQFAEITNHLSKYLSSIFHHEGVVLHGKIPVNKRKEIVEKFQSHVYIPYMVLSLKAGGVGLNLTEASHVIHFDRWWNPAVENQATDRVFRIGQKKNVMVHKFITRGTIEEKIDQMIESKKALSNEIISETGESWITELTNSELKNLFSLSI
jgi:SNF2 family DNA or RNA helicase